MLEKNDKIIIENIRQYVQSNMSTFGIYSPVLFNDVLIFDSQKREYSKQTRFKLISDNVKDGESFLDLGCNTGALINFLKSNRINMNLVGVEVNVELSDLCNLIKEQCNSNETFICTDMLVYVEMCKLKNIKYDSVSFMSVWDFDKSLSILDNLLSICNKRVFLEPTNHELNSIKGITATYISPMEKKYNLKVLGTTDYQNRFLIMVEKT